MNKEGKIVWRAKFNRGKELTVFLRRQLPHCITERRCSRTTEPPEESSGEDEPERDTGADKKALCGSSRGADY